ncbi:NAD-dependent histone deacetylase HST3 NDAI_0F00930 [Naumovozyma dairenensis CBS 421]|uniref:Deacetylase sirtuin-type domain-containing protein n=1 Tax=Naumovozyma dairenensis (strain ATCC 10597 / BCRC 20456 / CBS 421 / NBRC 0211 / NRRL Y-12639) TaxID=1071378 RepID=G0WCA1_NAUDC|nr:hypothetical protein NDAI_0F00930 [Naumovozyma dairenensis CBS 421]CCD25412.1 hypothetical protein NDAI_0F00930 [Naumovozyma dairenensis CBS 421]
MQSKIEQLRLDATKRSISFDEEDMSMNKSRKMSYTDLQTTKLTHVFELDNESNRELLNKINKLLNKSKRIIVLSGAGISCNAGIPDLDHQMVLYESVKKQFPEMSISSGKEMFDISLFRDELKISVFAAFMEKLYSNVKLAQPTKTHKFIAHLKNRNKLLRCYTQNIDGLEEILGLELSTWEDLLLKGVKFNNIWKNIDVVQLHGDLNSLACTRCYHNFPWSRYWARSLRNGQLPMCPECERKNLLRLKQGKRSNDTVGVLRPNIVLYGENHPSGDIITQGLNLDLSRGKPDFFIIMGTSLKVDGVKKVVKQMSKEVHERGGLVLLVNKTNIGDSSWSGVIDYQIMCDCDEWVEYLEEQLPDFFKTQRQIDRIRQLKREASDLRKKRLQLKKETGIKTTPPTTPTKDEVSSDGEEKDREYKYLSMKPEEGNISKLKFDQKGQLRKETPHIQTPGSKRKEASDETNADLENTLNEVTRTLLPK